MALIKRLGHQFPGFHFSARRHKSLLEKCWKRCQLENSWKRCHSWKRCRWKRCQLEKVSGRFYGLAKILPDTFSVFCRLISGDTLGHRDIFVHDRLAETTIRVSVSTAGVAGDDASFAPSISAFGDKVVFESDATNLVANDTLGHRDIFVRDLEADPQVTFRISVGLIGEADGPSSAPAISADGDFVLFHSDAANMVAGDTNGLTDVFVYEISSGTITRVSINSAQEQAEGGGSSYPAVSADGRYVAFESDATNLAPDDQGGFRDVFLRDRGFCLADLDGDGEVGADDLAILLGAWGPVESCPPLIAPDLDPDCEIEASDLAILLGAWGPCL